jgi:fatty-acyl-CoA synthase
MVTRDDGMQSDATLGERRAALERRHGRWRPRTLAGALDAVAAERPDRPYVLTDERVWTYAELAEWARRIARALVARGVRPGDHVAVLFPNDPRLVAVLYAVARAGAVAVPLNVRLRPRELAAVLRQSDSVGLIGVDRFRDVDVVAALDEIAPGWAQRGGGEALPRMAWAAMCPEGLELPGLDHDPDPALDDELAARAAAARADHPATIFYTSGTTGEPKGVVLTHDMVLRSAYGSALTRGFADGRRILLVLPVHHVFAYVEGLLASLFVAGGVILQPAFDPEAALRAIERHRATEALFVPTMTLGVLDAARAATYDLSSLTAVMSAAAPAPARLWEEVREELGVTDLVTGYGMTETSAATTFTMPDDDMERLTATVGRPKLGGIAGDPDLGGALAAYRVVDPETGAELPDGAEGELAGRGPIVTRGYYRRPEETAATVDADGWLRSGDLGRIRPDGYLELTGRSKDLYKCGGELVTPVEVEQVLGEHPGVAQAYVVGIADERMGEVGCAYVVAAEGAAPSEAALLEHCRTRLARFKVPAAFRFVTAAELPVTASGKVQKFVLAERELVAREGLRA